MTTSGKRSTIASLALTAGLLVSLSPASPGAWAQGLPIPDLDVPGPSGDFEMGSRLMTSGKRMEARVSVPGKGTAKMSKFNGTFFYRDASPEATTATLMFRADQFEDTDGKLSAALRQALDFDEHPFFAFQSHSASKSRNGVDLQGKLIVKDRETDVTLHMRSPGKVALNDKDERWIQFDADLEVAASDVGLESVGERLRFDFKVFLFNYTVGSAKSTGIDSKALDRNPPALPSDAAELSNAGWYLILTQRYPEAIAAFDKSIAANPESISAYLRRGDAYAFNGDYGKAVGTYKAMLRFMPAHPHMIELSKVLGQEYLTPASLHDVNLQWKQSQR